MAGYMSKLNSYMYEGELVNGASVAVPNGILMVHGTSSDVGKFVLPSAADPTSVFICKEVGEIYDGLKAYRFVVKLLNDDYYFVENNLMVQDFRDYNKADFTVEPGRLLRCHPLQNGDEFWTTNVTGTISVGGEYGVKTDGTIG